MKVLFVVIVAFVIIGAGAAYYYTASSTAPSAPKALDETSITEKEGTMMQYSGTVLAGTSASLLDFTKADFEAAIASDDLVLLYFYANWCPICAKEFPIMQSVFNELTTDQVIGFRVNYKDNDTDTDEVALAREQGVAYQHTKVFLKNGKQILKSPESWEKGRYLTEIIQASHQ